MKKVYRTLDGEHAFTRSRWIEIRHAYTVGKNNSLYEFATDENGYKPHNKEFNPANGVYLDYFNYNGCKYAIEQFICIGSMACPGEPYKIKNKDGSISTVAAVDFYGDLYNPLYIEIDEYGEKVRVYKKYIDNFTRRWYGIYN